jgi:hypothetical protein
MPRDGAIIFSDLVGKLDVLRAGPRIKASLLRPATMKSRLIMIDIDVMQVFIPWEFRVAGAFER